MFAPFSVVATIIPLTGMFYSDNTSVTSSLMFTVVWVSRDVHFSFSGYMAHDISKEMEHNGVELIPL